jgi:5'-nucleotidase (lipoprotein e(P4) family)
MLTRSSLQQTIVAFALGATPLFAQSPVPAPLPAPPATQLGVKYMRDSEEYAALAREVYRLAGDAVMRAAPTLGRQSWAVVLDIDETALDNSAYQLERAAYGLPFDAQSWAAWIARREAGAVPGVTDFVALVRRAGGHVAWITNRDATAADATRANLQTAKLWADDDRLCGQKSAADSKGMRRAEVVSGKGDCAWNGAATRLIVFVGDQMGDFPDAAEGIPGTGSDEAFGRTCFVLPNAMYGGWTTRVTRVR